MPNLFLQLEKYSLRGKTSRENLFTELFAYLLSTERGLKKKYLAHLFNGDKRLIRKFIDAEVQTQVRMHDKSIVDVCMEGKGGRGRLYIENKVDSAEGNGQIEKYLRLMHKGEFLVYMTPLKAPGPEFLRTKRNLRAFLGHFHWEEFYNLLFAYNASRKNSLICAALDYLEGANMKGDLKYSQQDLYRSGNAFAFIRKSNALLKMLWEPLVPILEERYGTNSGSSSVHDMFQYENVQCYFRRPKWGFSLYLFIMVGDDGRPYISFGPGCYKKQLVSLLRSDPKIAQKCRSLKKVSGSWESFSDNTWWEIQKYYQLKPKNLEALRDELLPKLKKAFKELNRTKLIAMLAGRNKAVYS